MDNLVKRVRRQWKQEEVVSIAYQGNIVDLWEKFADEEYKG